MSAETETVVAVYDLPETRVKLGLWHSAPVFLVVHSTGRVSINYTVEPGIVIELRSVEPAIVAAAAFRDARSDAVPHV